MSNDERIAVLETTITHIHETLERIEQRMYAGFTEVNKRIDTIEQKIISCDQKIESKFDTLDRKIDSNFKWLLGTMIFFSTGILGLIGHLHHLI